MPLHLLGKKSWNVYNPENIEQVRRDEAAAKAREEERERQSRNADDEARLRALRGTKSPPVPQRDLDGESSTTQTYELQESSSPSRKRRRLEGENETDRDIRLAKSDVRSTRAAEFDRDSILDSRGHISLVPQSQPGIEPRRESKRERGEPEKPEAGMRLKDAAGFNSDSKPWYTSREGISRSGNEAGKDVWGNEDPRRQEREQRRMDASDPLLAMKKGVKQLRQNERQRKEWMDQRERDLYEVERLARSKREKGHRRDKDRDDKDSLDEFDLDASPTSRPRHGSDGRSQETRKMQSHPHHRHRSRDPGGGRRHRTHHRRSAEG